MIKLFRVDHRLLHGQVVYSWTKFLGCDCILIACDTVLEDKIKMTAIKMAKPAGIKLVIKSINDSIEALKSNVTDKYNLLIIVENINDAFKIAEKCEEIKVINIGGLKKNTNNHQIDKAIFLSNKEIEKLLQLYEKGIKFDTRMVPNDTSKNIIEEIRKVNI